MLKYQQPELSRTQLRSCVMVHVAVLGFPSLIVLMVFSLRGRKATLNLFVTELRSCVKVHVAVLGFPSLIVLMVFSLRGHKATLNLFVTELTSCVKVKVAVLCSPSLIILMVSVDVKQHWTLSVQRASSIITWDWKTPYCYNSATASTYCVLLLMLLLFQFMFADCHLLRACCRVMCGYHRHRRHLDVRPEGGCVSGCFLVQRGAVLLVWQFHHLRCGRGLWPGKNKITGVANVGC